MVDNELKHAEARAIAIDSIRYDSMPGTSLAACDDAMLKILGRIIRRFGQPRPVVVAPEKGADRHDYWLIAGTDVFLAVRDLGQRAVLARITDLDEYKAAVQFYRYELLRLDLSWENQARYLLALHDLYRERQYFSPSLPTLGALSGLPTARIRDLLHGITLLNKHNLRLSDGTIPFPTLLRPIRTTYPEALQKEMIRGLVEEGWTRRRATEYAAERLTVGVSDLGKAMRREVHLNLVGVGLARPGNGQVSQTGRGAGLAVSAAGGGR